MKKAKSVIKGMAMILSMTGIIITSATVPAMASEAQPEIARTRAWDSIEHTLGGIPESVRMIEYAGSTFYLGEGVTEDNFVSFITNPEELLLKAAKDSGKLYGSPVYLLWNADKTVLLVHSMISDPGELLKTTVIPINAPASLTGESAAEQPQSTTVLRLNAANISITPLEGMTEEQTVEYMLSDEYADAVRLEFYKILNEYRSDNG